MDIGSIVSFVLGAICIVVSGFSFKEKGILINNEYLWASNKDRQEMSVERKRPYFRQSGVVFLLLGGAFICLGLESTLKLDWIFVVVNILMGVDIIYAVVSTIYISKKQKN